MTVVVGVGARSGVSASALAGAVEAALGEAGLVIGEVRVLATIDRRAIDEGVRSVAEKYGWELVGLAAAELARQRVPHPARTVARAVGTPSVAEAAALAAAGPRAVLRLPKRIFAGVTVAIAEAGPQ